MNLTSSLIPNISLRAGPGPDIRNHLYRPPPASYNSIGHENKVQSPRLEQARLQNRAELRVSNVSDSPLINKSGTTTYSFSESYNVQISPEGQRLSYESSTEYHFISSPVIDVTPVVETETPRSVSPKESAENILQLMGNHLDRIASDGSTEQDLETAVEKEIEAYARGRDEAITTLAVMGIYDDGMREDIEKTTELVLHGIEELKREFTPADPDSPVNKDSRETDNVATTVSSKPDNVGNKTEVSLKRTGAIEEIKSSRGKKSHHASYVQERLSNKQTINLQIETTDGDTITLKLNQSENIERQQKYGSHSKSDSELTLRNKTDFSIVVSGELDRGEMEALSKLIDQISDLASVFQSGDDAAAFELAKNLDLGASDLISMSLNITNTKNTTAVYESVAGSGRGRGHHHGSHHQELMGLTGYMKGLGTALETASRFGQPQELISDLFATYLAKLELESTDKFPVRLEQLLDTNDRILDSLTFIS